MGKRCPVAHSPVSQLDLDRAELHDGVITSVQTECSAARRAVDANRSSFPDLRFAWME